ncbi:glycosyltransferase [Dictyostelium purpureum]|uniref:Glycosyltransferase n=1 Tax=Dictyostelium purpureum TaxID=5786 RepID=F0ZH29_DICPU|nr:glycosyltransferase [Dictyostelium purpureum]EGC36760.1 glycosyltransferase [Dictyostelium purpureum]|eukprot:XP_003286706.1 glycosyltransferase [Dictyostelium purpureum]
MNIQRSQSLNNIINEKLGRIIVASNTLPISITKITETPSIGSPLNASKEIPLTSSFGMSEPVRDNGNGGKIQVQISSIPFPIESALDTLMNKQEIEDWTWIGWSHVELPEEDFPSLERSIKDFNNHFEPIFLNEHLVDGYYKGYCKNALWLLLHYQLNFVKMQSEWWDDYVVVNQMFANKIAATWRPGDIIWIHDYHLMLVPQMLRKLLPLEAPIGFFFHAPFPSYELFRILPNRKEILKGILGSNLIGFQSFEYLRHFRSSCARLLDLEVHPKGLEIVEETFTHFTKLQVYPIGVDYNDFVKNLNLPDVASRIESLRKIFKGKKVLVARDRLDQIEAVPRKLEVIESLLNDHPEYHGKLVFIQIYEPTVEEEDETEEQKILHKTVNEMVGRINGKFGKLSFNPIEYINRKVTYEELSALYKLADVALITPIRDGMNLTSHEYVVCQKDNFGVLILSEFAGAARCLGGAIIVNPFSKKEIMGAIIEALNMNGVDKKLKHQINYNYVLANTSSFWGKRFLCDLNEATQQEVQETRVLKANIPEIEDSYKKSKSRVFFLDYDGTLTPLVRLPSQAMPSKHLIDTLAKLASDPKNDVYIISGRDRVSLEKWLGHIPVGMSCEHGVFTRPPGVNQPWVESPNAEQSWKETVLQVMQDFEDRTPGSMVEIKQVNLTWHYRNADPDFGQFQARELVAQLYAVANKYPLDILSGKKAIEVKPIGVNKGEIVKMILSKSSPDFILCIGDDKTDEDMFKVLTNVPSYSIRVTADLKESTKAKGILESSQEVLSLLNKLSSL